jgi:hypothetical protein
MMLIDFVLDVVGYTTSRLLIPALTFQKVKVDALSSGKAGFNWLGFKNACPTAHCSAIQIQPDGSARSSDSSRSQ